jgi:hypothetical protein
VPLGLTPLPPALLGTALAIVLAYGLFTEAKKRWFSRHAEAAPH